MIKSLDNCNNIVCDLSDFEQIYLLAAPQSWMLVKDKSFPFLPDSLKETLEKHKDNCTVFDEFTPNPKYEEVLEGVKLLKNNGCSLIVAVGGGSTIDVAKCIKLFSTLDSNDNYLNQRNRFEEGNNINFVAIPTTAGTGSESTRHAVIYYQGKKQSIASYKIIPNVVILEPSVLISLPLNQKKYTLFDALCQAIESWWSNNANEESVTYSKEAIKRIVKYIDSYLVEKPSTEVCKEILIASNYAGRAINTTATTAAHAMSYKITSLYNFPHGYAVAVCFPVVWEHMLSHDLSNELIKKFNDIANYMGFDNPKEAISWFKNKLNQLNMINPVSSNYDIDIKTLVDSVNPERLSNNPIQFDKEELTKMYKELIQR